MIVALLVNLVANGGYSYRVRSAAIKPLDFPAGPMMKMSQL
jgi:hypothetical protein